MIYPTIQWCNNPPYVHFHCLVMGVQRFCFELGNVKHYKEIYFCN